jgi:hypothetical protein
MGKICCIIYDSIHNSVFESQVLIPLLARLNKENSHAILISFEKNPSSSFIPSHFNQYADRIQFIFLPKSLFFGRWSLLFGVRRLQSVIKSLNISSCIARGPLAGFIAHEALKKTKVPLTIQIRGLLTEEYLYSHKNSSPFVLFLHYLRAQLYKNVENYVYCLAKSQQKIMLEAVSPALKEYLVSTYQISPEKISFPLYDHPAFLPPAEKKYWRDKIRQELKIFQDAYVWCYSGSAKPWQCPEETIRYFKTAAEKSEKQAVLCIFTQELEVFHELCAQYGISQNSIRILSVPHDQVYHYLSACDEGIIVREPHILNWVSRPTKILEYRAVGLAIAHNSTIELLTREG